MRGRGGGGGMGGSARMDGREGGNNQQQLLLDRSIDRRGFLGASAAPGCVCCLHLRARVAAGGQIRGGHAGRLRGLFHGERWRTVALSKPGGGFAYGATSFSVIA